ncbi:MAG TPA: EAL domain-containing protein [Mycobacterium sp.]|nr:EAL domain-containing protein [Mycobacterium sp.]
MAEQDAARPRLRLNRAQWVLAGVLGLLLLALVVLSFQASAQQREHTESLARTEAENTNAAFTLRETLTYIDTAERYLLGVAPRREVQVARALLGQRLDVVGADGVTAGQAASPEYQAALRDMDAAVEQLPAGVIPDEQRKPSADMLLPKARALTEQTRRMSESSSAGVHREGRVSDEQLLRGRRIQIVLILAALTVGTVLLWWVTANVARQYRSARKDLDSERQTLRETQHELHRVSALEREQAQVLERIATGEPVPTVLRKVVRLAAEVSGAQAVRIAAGEHTVVHPPEVDVSERPAWSATFLADAAGNTGSLEVFGGPELLDELTHTALLRCRELVALALERDASARQLSFQATHDALTGLANRSLLLSRLADSLMATRRRGTQLAVLFCDLDRFKMVNDSIGHAGGDQLLIEAARRLTQIVRENDTVARLGGDEFVVLCPDLPDRAQANALAERVRTTLSAPYAIDGKEAFVDASIGITFADDSTVSGAELMREADVAMYRAKLTEGSHINVFDSRLEAEVAERLDLDAALRRALERDQLRLAAQPVVMLDTGAITGFELLLHWRRPGLPVLSPGTFIPLAEDNGMIVDIGRWVLQQAVAQLAEWRAAGLAQGLTISVNVSARQVRDPDFADEVLALLISEQVPPESLVIELTEHALIDLRLAHPTLTRLRDAGVQVSLDDFGTGYSSLTQLRTLPVDQIKLDRSFTAALDEGSPKQQAVVESVVALANALALDLVIEGVETLTEREALLRAGASKGQGFLFSHPMPLDAARELLASGAVCAAPSPQPGMQPGARQ